MDEAPALEPAQGEETTYRGFLFADLRGYTAFVEAHGSRAAADLLDAYRELVRREVAAHAGAEIKTEGDSFYVVFGSAERAVACGLGIVAAAARTSGTDPHRPIQVGIGINAGETIQRGEGFVGAAVNLAARVCSQARAGEVLVTGTVRDATRGDAELRFTPRGARHLKGIAEPVPLYAVARRTGAERSRRLLPLGRSGLRLLAIGLPILAALVAAVIVWAVWLRGAQGLGVGSSASVRAASSSPLATAPVGAFPNADEAALLARIDPAIADHCERADPDARPRLSVDRQIAGLGGSGTTQLPIRVSAGLACKIPSAFAPSVVYYWSTSALLDFSAAGMPNAQIVSQAARLGIQPGDCASQASAYGQWEFGGSRGRVLCGKEGGDAITEWSYEGLPLLAVAIRHDGDSQALYEWWRDNGRFLRSS